MQQAAIGSRSIVVGVIPEQPDLVIRRACEIAKSMLVPQMYLVYVNSTLIENNGHIEPLDSDSMNDSWHRSSAQLSDHVLGIARDCGVDAQYDLLAGDPAKELTKFAQDHHAVMIVVGTRERGAVAALTEWANGSVSVRLSHSQKIPVLTVPLADEYHH